MVLESLLFPITAEKKPWQMFFLGFLYASIGLFVALWIFRDQASLVMVFMITMAAIPIFYNTMKLEESKDLLIDTESHILREHNKAISFFMYMFVGMTFACALWYSVLLNIFSRIFFNNLKVLAFSILFSLVYGAGAIFILAWNSTVIGAAIGNFIRSNVSSYTSSLGLLQAGNYFHVVSIGLLKYSIHGIPEIAAYFYGGLAGGILSVAIIRKHFKTNKFPAIMVDFSELILIAIGFLVAAAFLEVYVTPALF